ncbi:F-box only protein 5, partial [Eschrichtius robustus]|nr:F-box only protein 5 [Eschrichtius robustus]
MKLGPAGGPFPRRRREAWRERACVVGSLHVRPGSGLPALRGPAPGLSIFPDARSRRGRRRLGLAARPRLGSLQLGVDSGRNSEFTVKKNNLSLLTTCQILGCKEESSTVSVKMKCDFNYNHVHSGIKPVKPDDNRRQGSYTTANLEGSYKDFIKDYERTPLVSVQKSATQTLPKKDARTKLPDPGDQKGSTYSRHSEFSEVARTLKKNESLKACIRCNSPAKYDCYLQRATCKREGCGFDYCT